MIDLPLLDTLVKISQLIGIPVAIAIYFFNKRRERIDREYGTYDALDDKYIHYLELCIENPDLDVADVPKAQPAPLTQDQQHRELIMFSILVAIMERAYLMYKDKSTSVRREQWTGWNMYIRDWCTRKNFAAALPKIKEQFDEGFLQYLESLIRATSAGSHD